MANKPNKQYSGLTSPPKLYKNTLLVIGFKVFPILIGIFSIPYLILNLGAEKFGFLAIIWLVVGYFSLFDLGLGRASIKLQSELIERQKYFELSKAGWTGIISISIAGLFSGLLLYLSVNFIAETTETSRFEYAKDAFIYTSFTVPFIISTSGFKSILEAQQRFFVIGLIQSVNSSLNYLLPVVLVYFFEISFLGIIQALLAVRLIVFLVFTISTLILERSLLSGVRFHTGYFKEMFHFGKWVTISNFLGPLIGQLDRYFIAAFISVSAVTFYTTPIEVLAKLMMFPMSLITVIFPAFSALSQSSNKKRETIFLESVKGIIILLFPAFIVLSTFSYFGLEVWLGSEFADKSVKIAHIFCAVFFIRGTAYIPSTYLTGINKPKYPAIFHIIEIILLSLGLYYIAKTESLILIAFVSLGITLLDTSLLFATCYYEFKNRLDFVKVIIIPISACTSVLFILIFVNSFEQRVVLFACSLLVFFGFYYSSVVSIFRSFFRSIIP